MGISSAKNQLKSVATTTLIVRIQHAAEALRDLAAVADEIGSRLEDAERLKKAAKTGNLPLDFDEFARAISQGNFDLAETLARCDVVRFDLGRLVLRPRSGADLAYLNVMRDILAGELATRFGRAFKIRLG